MKTQHIIALTRLAQSLQIEAQEQRRKGDSSLGNFLEAQSDLAMSILRTRKEAPPVAYRDWFSENWPAIPEQTREYRIGETAFAAGAAFASQNENLAEIERLKAIIAAQCKEQDETPEGYGVDPHTIAEDDQ